MGVIVVGMHRSGTSAMTGALHALGLSVGDPDALIGASDHNPRGHWEIQDLVMVNEMLLRELGGSWFAPPAVDSDDLARLAGSEWREGALRVQRKRLPPEDEPWVWKDPRLCLLLDFWRSVLDDSPALVMMLRSPEHVARSLARRSGIDVEYGLALWERYTRTALDAAEGLPTWVVHYEELIADPASTIDELLGHLDEEGLAPPEPDLDAAAELATWSPAAPPDPDIAEVMTEPQRDLAEVVGELRGPTEPDAVELPDESPGLDERFRSEAPEIAPVLRPAPDPPGHAPD